jgi:GGDEF domain-containing protein
MELALQAASYIGEATCLANLAESLSDIGRNEEALELLESWQEDPLRMAPTGTSHHAHTCGIVLTRVGRDPEAIEVLKRCLAQAPTRPLEITACRALAEAYERTGDLRAALEHHKRLSTLVSKQSSEAARRAGDFQHQALEDALTGMPNRRRFDELFDSDRPLSSIIMVDVDHFKRLNDDHSHLVGDAVLRELGNLLQANRGEGDVALRIGGEDFAVWLSGASEESAVAVAERIRSGVVAYA